MHSKSLDQLSDEAIFSQADSDKTLYRFISEVARRGTGSCYYNTPLYGFCVKVSMLDDYGLTNGEEIEMMGNFLPNWIHYIQKWNRMRNRENPEQVHDIDTIDIEACEQMLLAWITEAQVTTPGQRMKGIRGP